MINLAFNTFNNRDFQIELFSNITLVILDKHDINV